MRLIDADELLEHAGRDKLDSRELIIEMIQRAPTIMTEVVQCKDCKYYDGNGTCMKNGIALLTDYWFCADGKGR